MAHPSRKSNKGRKKATRVNKKLIAMVVSGILLAGGIVAAFWAYNQLQSTARNIRAGDELMTSGDFRQARKQYGRAVRKEGGNLGHIKKLRESISSIAPGTPGEASAFYDEYVDTLVHEARYNPNSAEAQLQLVYELYAAARITNSEAYWQKLRIACATMLDRISEDDPRRYEAVLYQGLARLRTEDSSLAETFDDEGHIVFPGEDDLQAALESDLGNDLAWAMLAHGRMAVYYRLDNTGRKHQAEKNRELAERTMKQAMEAAPQGMEVALTHLREAILRRSRLQRDWAADQDAVSQADLDAASAGVRVAAAHLLTTFDPSRDAIRTREVVQMLLSSGESGREPTLDVLRRHLAAHEDDLARRLVLAEVLLMLDRPDEAEVEADRVLDMPQRTVGIGAIEQYQLRSVAAKLLFDIAASRVSDKEGSAREAAVADATARRDRLSALVSGDADNPMVLDADARLAVWDRDWNGAATKLERLLAVDPSPSAETYHLAAQNLLRAGSPGLALERVSRALELRPGTIVHYLLKAGIEYELARYDVARRTLSMLPPEVLAANPDARQLLDNISLQLSGQMRSGAASAIADPILQVIAKANEARMEGRIDDAAALLESAIMDAEKPDWRLFAGMANVRLAQENREAAVALLERAMALEPGHNGLEQMYATLTSDDEVAAYIAMARATVDEEEQDAVIAAALYELAGRRERSAATARRMGRGDEAARSLDIATRARAESKRFQERAAAKGGSNTALVIVQFEQAISDGDFDAAEALIPSLGSARTGDAGSMLARVKLDLARAVAARESGDDAGFEKNGDLALSGAREMTEAMPFDSSGWRLLGIVETAKRNSIGALEAYTEAYRLAPTDLQNVQRYVGALLSVETEPQRLLRVLQTAHQQFPMDRMIDSAWLEVESKHGDRAAVLEIRRQRNQRNPMDRENSLRYAKLLLSMEPKRETMVDANGRERFSQRAWVRMSRSQKANVLEEVKEQWDDEITEILATVAKTPDPDLITAILRAEILRDRGQLDDASAVLDAFVAGRSSKSDYEIAVIAAADFLRRSGRMPQAVALLTDAREKQGEDLRIDAALGTLYYVTGKHSEAAEFLRPAVEASGDPTLHGRWVESLARSQQFDAAEAAIEGMRGTNTRYSTAMLRALVDRGRSEMLLAQGKTEDVREALTNYRAALEDAISADPSNPVPYVRLARSLLNEYWTTQDRELLEESLDIILQGSDENDTSESLAIVQADVLQADGQLRRAIDDMDRFLVRVPGSITIRQRLIDGHLDADDLEKAIAAARGGIAVDAADATWHERLGDLLNRASGKPAKVLPPYLEAYARNQSSGVLGKIDEVTRTSEPWPWQDVLTAIDGSGVGQPPIAGVIEAKALYGLGRQRDALQIMTATYGRYREAIENKWITSGALMDWYADLRILFPEDPSGAEAFARGVVAGNMDARDTAGLALLWKSYGPEHVDRAVQLIDDVLPSMKKGTAEHATLLATRGAYLVEAERYQEGSEAFAELVEAYPENPAFLNNYAYIIGVYLGQPAKALPIAQKAASLAPRFPSVLDTVAMLYHRTGDDRRAADTLSFLVQIDPTNAEALARLAVLYAGSLNEADRAVPLAERARSQKPRSAEVLDALGWSYLRSGRPGKGEEILNRSISREPTMSAYMHLAQALSDRGKAEEAINTLRLAEDLATDSYSRNSIDRLEDDIRNAQAAVGD